MLINNAIEQAILSTIIFNQTIHEVVDIIEPNDFYHPTHKNIYATMIELYKSDLPIDEEFIRNRAKVTEEVMLSILTANPISNIAAYARELKQSSRKRELETLIKQASTIVSAEDANADEVLNNVKQLLSNFENKQYSDAILNILNFNQITEQEPKFYLENILPIQDKEINIISAKGGSGKSYTTAYLMLELANKHNLKCFGWFSEDAAGTTKKRINSLSKLHNLPIQNITIIGKENRALQFVSLNNRKLEINSLFYGLKKQLKEFDVIILDPLIAFFGADENSNADARYFMNLLNEWCEKDNKTIILIHHHSKGDSGTARGAGAFVDACRIHYTLDYKYVDKEKKAIDDNLRILKIEKTNHFSGKREYEIKLFESRGGYQPELAIEKSPAQKVQKTRNDFASMPKMFDDEF